MKNLFKGAVMAALAIATSLLFTQSGLPSSDDVRNEKELAQLTDDRSTPPGQSVDDDYDDEDDYDVSLEDPVIEDDVPTTWQEFAEDARKTSTVEQPMIMGPEFGSVTLPSDAYLIE
ncbi:hypothetical protein [Nocardia amamiensis]|uniref:hypothetical protein n=1 Tax=Nocardia amamiensis TaxID=404578 RepID=UPI00083343F1|nr:hypothetical protein [Nocardia amamiensis]